MIRECVDLVLFMMIVIMVIIGSSIGIVAGFESYQCGKYSENTGKPTKYSGLECYVQDGQWYSWAEYKNRLVAKGEMK